MYPKLIIGKKLVQGYLANQEGKRIYPCTNLKELRQVISDLSCIVSDLQDEICIYLKVPTGHQYGALLKFIESTKFKVVLLVMLDNVTGTIISRMKQVLKDEDVELRSFVDRYRCGDTLKQKLNYLLQ